MHCSTSPLFNGAHGWTRDENVSYVRYRVNLKLEDKFSYLHDDWNTFDNCYSLNLPKQIDQRMEQRPKSDDNDIGICYLIGIEIEIELSHDKLTILIQIGMQMHLSLTFDQKFTFIRSLSFSFISSFTFDCWLKITTFAPAFNL